MKPRSLTLILRLCAGLGLSGFGIISGLVQWFDGQSDKGLATAVIYTLLACIVAPLAEDVEDFVRRASKPPEQ